MMRLVIAVVLLTSCAPLEVSPDAAECVVDTDCVRDACCHATACVPASQAPVCTAITCTEICQAGTLDCGGSCGCVAGRCVGRGR